MMRCFTVSTALPLWTGFVLVGFHLESLQLIFFFSATFVFVAGLLSAVHHQSYHLLLATKKFGKGPRFLPIRTSI